MERALGYDKKPAAQAPSPTPKPAAQPRQQAPGKPGKPLSEAELAMPDEIKGNQGARERFEKISRGYREVSAQLATITAERDKMQETRQGFAEILRESQTSAEDLNVFLSFNSAYKSGRYKEALDIIDAVRADIAQRGGLDLPGVDLLKDHQDLLGEVNNGVLTRERALEIAGTRRTKAEADQRAAAQRQADDAQQQKAKEFEDGKKALAAWSRQKAASDIDYRGKEAKILPRITEIMKDYPPSLWVRTMDEIYSGITVAVKGARPTGSNIAPLPAAAGGGAAQPKTMLDALEIGLGYQKAS